VPFLGGEDCTLGTTISETLVSAFVEFCELEEGAFTEAKSEYKPCVSVLRSLERSESLIAPAAWFKTELGSNGCADED
jgi:hypothetical protein